MSSDFDPGICSIEVPAGAEAGAKVNVPLPKAMEGILTVPEGAKAGDKFEVRPLEAYETVTVEVSKSAPTLKEMQELRVGVTLTGNEWEHPIVTEPVAEEGRAFGKLQRGDVLTRVAGNNAKGPIDQEARGSLKTAALLKDCIGPVTITAKRPATRLEHLLSSSAPLLCSFSPALLTPLLAPPPGPCRRPSPSSR